MEQRQDRLAVLERALAELQQQSQRVQQRLALWRGLAGLVLVLALVVVPLRVMGQGGEDGNDLSARITALEAALARETAALKAVDAALGRDAATGKAVDAALQVQLSDVRANLQAAQNNLSAERAARVEGDAREAQERQTDFALLRNADTSLRTLLTQMNNAVSPVLSLLGVNPSGGLVVDGDLAVRHLGVNGNLAVGGGIVATGAIDARGDIGVTRNLYVGGDTVAFGAIDARGDIGVTRNLFVGGDTVAFGTLEARKGIVSLGDVNVCGSVSDTFGGGILHANFAAKVTKDCPEPE